VYFIISKEQQSKKIRKKIYFNYTLTVQTQSCKVNIIILNYVSSLHLLYLLGYFYYTNQLLLRRTDRKLIIITMNNKLFHLTAAVLPADLITLALAA